MIKRMLSLLCVLALLPVTALAAEEDAPATLYVGNTVITNGYWIPSNDGISWTIQSDEPAGDSYIHYDANGTLKLNNVTITGDGSNNVSLGAGIYAVSSANSDVALTIMLEGTSTVSGAYGVCVQANQTPSSGGNSASLTISGHGVLTATGNPNHGIAIVGYFAGAALTIKDATVTSQSSSKAGVFVQSGATASDSPSISLAVNGGSLTTQRR